MKNFKAVALFFGMLFVSCASTRNITVPEDVQTEVQEVIGARNYLIYFYRPHVSRLNDYNYDQYGMLRICGDTLKQHYSFLSDEFQIYKLSDYQQYKTESGATEITFNAIKYTRKSGREIPVVIPYRLKIHSMEEVEVYIDKIDFRGKLINENG